MYDFSTVPDRTALGSVKWLNMKKNNPAVPDNILPFSIADMELPVAPEIIASLQEFISHSFLGYSMPTENYFRAVSMWMKDHHAWPIKADWILPSPGVVPALFNAVRAFTKKGDGVIVMTPVYYPFFRAVEKNERKLISVPLIYKNTHYQIDFDTLAKAAHDNNNNLLILCNPHNPVGRVWNKKELLKIADICLQKNVLMISDEIHSDIIMPGHEHTALASLNDTIANNCITCTAPSKTFNIAGIQVSNIIIKNHALRHKFMNTALQAGYGALNILGYKACETAYTKCSNWLDEFITLIVHNKKLSEDYIKKNLPQIKVIDMEGTYLQWWDCSGLGLTYKNREILMNKKAFLFSDNGYMFGREGINFERINLACPSNVLENALIRLTNVLKNC
ncbi:MalY/PatB family protein [Pectinatus sottacetonis]|uniref:MalY/PatB family protein n=1 Tax=Pectinatus sottacetonis TaxID=1002795 RepID=UPI0018C57629|nr:MalY/PatB family protein [Pectinatus sottacetonis]